jgi:hypothetical protein
MLLRGLDMFPEVSTTKELSYEQAFCQSIDGDTDLYRQRRVGLCLSSGLDSGNDAIR